MSLLEDYVYGTGDLARWAGMNTGRIVALLIASPGIALDKAINGVLGECVDLDNEYTIEALDPFYMASPRIFQEQTKTAYKGGFFSKYPLGLVGQAVAVIPNVAVTLAVASAGVGLALAAGGTVLGLALVAAAIAAVVWFVQACFVGPSQACKNFGCT